MGSYNYLGFAQPTGACADDAELTTLKSGVSVCSSRHELGISILLLSVLALHGHIKTTEQRTIIYNKNTVIGTLVVDGWAVTFGTARRGLGGAPVRPGPSSLYQM